MQKLRHREAQGPALLHTATASWILAVNSVCRGPGQVLFPGTPLQIPTSYHLQAPLPTCASWAEVFIPQSQHLDDNSGYYRTGTLSGPTGEDRFPPLGTRHTSSLQLFLSPPLLPPFLLD